MSLGPLMIDLRGPAVCPEERDWLRHPAVGGVILFKRNFESIDQLEALVEDIHSLRSPSLLVAVDQEGGRVQRFGAPFTILPAPRRIGHLYDEDPRQGLETARAFAWLMAAELGAVGIDMSFAPVVDCDLGLAEVIGDRALHGAAGAVADLALQFAAGAQSAGMAITAKHFPTHAGARADSHIAAAVDRRDYDALGDDLEPYRRLIANGLHAVMVGHVIFPAIDPSPASLSRHWIQGILRTELGFGGAIIADDMSMQGAVSGGPPAERVRTALAAGCDLVLLCNAPEQVAPTLQALEGYVDPPAQLRLMRLRGRSLRGLALLHESKPWKLARERVLALGERPPLRLES